MATDFLSRWGRMGCMLKRPCSSILRITNFRCRSRSLRTEKTFPFTSPGVVGLGISPFLRIRQRKMPYQADAGFKRVNLRSMKDQEQDFTTVRAGVEDQYFLAMFLLSDNPAMVKTRKQEYPSPDAKAQVPTLLLAAMVPESRAIRVYVGPKQRD